MEASENDNVVPMAIPVAVPLPEEPITLDLAPWPGPWQAVLLMLVLIGAQFVTGLPLGILAVAFKPGPAVQNSLSLLATLVAAGAAIWFGLYKAGRPWREVLRLTPFTPWVLPAIIFLMLGLGIIASEADNLLQAIVPVPAGIREMFEAYYQTPVIAFLLLVIAAPITEEPIFRGIMLSGLLKRTSIFKAALISSALFMVVHLNPYQFFVAFTFGMVAAWLYMKTKSLWPCLLSHALLNLLNWVAGTQALPFVIPGFNSPHDATEVLFQPLWFDGIGVVLMLLGALLLHRIPGPPASVPNT